jgi:tripartite-type tricarboxylate transporter receptor subunit TctC
MLPRFVIQLFSVCMLVLVTNVVSGQNYPNKPIRLVAGGVGGGLDFVARLIAPPLTVSLGQPVIVENRGGNLPAETVSRAPPDGYALLVAVATLRPCRSCKKRLMIR